METENSEKLRRVKDALIALGQVQTDDDIEMALLKGICHAITAYRLYLGGTNEKKTRQSR